MKASAPPARPRLLPPDPRWSEPDPPDALRIAALTGALKLPRAVCAVLAARGFGPEDAKPFLRPRLEHLHDPEALADGARAAERIARAIRAGETVLVHGDYDVDGICATALLTRWLTALGARAVPFVPHRLRDGYDFGDAGVRAARDAGAGLIVTADCGTVAHEAVAQAGASGIDVIVTDHHTVGPSLPPAHAVVNPMRPDCPYPEKQLCGTGLAYKLSELVARAAGADPAPLVEYLDLVALATVADLVPLSGENRVLVHYGLRRFTHTRVAGLSALLHVAGVDPPEVTTGRLGFAVAPRINAAGRIGESADALRLLLSDDRVEVQRIAAALDDTNRRRQEEDQRTLDEALELLDGDFDPDTDYGVVMASEGWHPGVIGIVASRIVERVYRPVVLLALDGERARGSARSIPGFHLYDALAACAPHMLRFGGHRQAAGMDVERAAVPALRAAFNREARARLKAEDLRPTLRPDIEIPLGEVDLQFVHWLGYLGPHGIGNPGPLLLARGLELQRPRVVGDGHLKATLVAAGARLDAIGFRMAERFPPALVGASRYDALFRVELNEWRGSARPQALLADLRPSVGRA